MINNDIDTSGDRGRGTMTSRRRFLTVFGGAAAASLAGCSGLRSRSFEASPVTMSAADQDTLLLGETVRDSQTLERDALDGNVSVSISNHVAVYSRAAGLGGT